jgi:hypothetical protein
MGVVAASYDGSAFSWVETMNGPEIQYWVAFDEPQFDGDGDGPYTAAEVLARYVEPL